MVKKKRLRQNCLGRLRAQYVSRHVLKSADQLYIVLNPRLGEGADITRKERLRFRFGIGRNNQPLSMGISDRRNEIVALPIKNALDGIAHHLILCTHFAANAHQRTTQDRSALLLDFNEPVVYEFEIAIEAFERRGGWRKDSVHFLPLLVPICLQGSSGELRFRFEKIIKASLFCSGALANCIYRSGSVAVLPEKIHGRVGQALLHVTYSWHNPHLIQLDQPVNYFLKIFWRAIRPGTMAFGSRSGGLQSAPAKGELRRLGRRALNDESN